MSFGTNLKQLIRDNRWFLIPFMLIWLLSFIGILLLAKPEVHLFLNGYHTPFFDQFFIYVTELGASIPAIVCVLLFFYKVRVALFVTTVQLAANTVTALLKSAFQIDRPRLLFEQLDLPLYMIEGLHIHSHNSFPSGHTTAAFALFFALCLIFRNNYLKFGCFLLATLAGFSRIYLSQHFLEDVLAGSLIGTLSGLLLYYYFDNSRTWGESSLQKYIAGRIKK